MGLIEEKRLRDNRKAVDVCARESGVIESHGCCVVSEANYDKLYDARIPSAGVAPDPEKNKERLTTSEVACIHIDPSVNFQRGVLAIQARAFQLQLRPAKK